MVKLNLFYKDLNLFRIDNGGSDFLTPNEMKKKKK